MKARRSGEIKSQRQEYYEIKGLEWLNEHEVGAVWMMMGVLVAWNTPIIGGLLRRWLQ
jgi:hypothetical protein